MIIIGNNLKGLIESRNICEPELFDEFSISVKMDKLIARLLPNSGATIKYGLSDVKKYYQQEELSDSLILTPMECVLACSTHKFCIPYNYIGFLQTKGTLARLFVSAHCSDSHIEPGFNGKITLEITNHSPFNIEIPVNSIVAQLFIMRCSTVTKNPYNGKYSEAQEPTIPLPF
jgi:deoxycytidine triphosphate deaminase